MFALKIRVMKGKYQILYMSPEMAVRVNKKVEISDG